MPTPSKNDLLAGFGPEVREAFERFCATGDEASLRIIVEAAVRSFMPARGAAARDLPLRDDARLVEDLGFDSLAVAETAFFFEDLFQITITNPELLSLRTVGELRAFAVLKYAERKPAA
jgi:acyl carrier protein